MNKTKPFDIPKALVWKAYKLVKVNKGSAGIDQESIKDFEQNLSKNIYKLWNRLSSGTYFPPAVKGVEIPKKQGGIRTLGIPTVVDRIAQMTVKLAFEPCVEPIFLENSYGYRPNKSALDAVGVTRQRCWYYNWVLEFDIKGLFDNIDHDLLMKAVRKHTNNRWIILYIERWLKAPMEKPDGSRISRTCGTPQGGVISPILSNLFLHYVFDRWMTIKHREKQWCRYADDGIAHCKTEAEAQNLLVELKLRFAECGLEVHPEKTKIVYCKDGKRRDNYKNTKFKFLGYEFRRRKVKGYNNKIFLSFTPAISKEAKKDICRTIRKTGVRNRSDLSLEEVAKWLNPKISGWINYYGKFNKSALKPVMRQINFTLIKWCTRKYKRFRYSKAKACQYMIKTCQKQPYLFAHWRKGIQGSFV
ncbi:MAG: Group II intron-encoded protein LtrA [Candidatus Anoxychlamydiales bacterium]|nr:Group II intron-encoded protein LtrA [Candidatus Anoxychlamydiales bacterium]